MLVSHERLREAGLVDFVVAVLAVGDQINQHVLLEPAMTMPRSNEGKSRRQQRMQDSLLAILHGDAAGVHGSLGVVAVDVNDGDVDHFHCTIHTKDQLQLDSGMTREIGDVPTSDAYRDERPLTATQQHGRKTGQQSIDAIEQLTGLRCEADLVVHNHMHRATYASTTHRHASAANAKSR